MKFSHLFEGPPATVDLSAGLVFDLDPLSDDHKRVVVACLLEQVDPAAAHARLHEVLQAALFDVSAAERGALVHRPGHA